MSFSEDQFNLLHTRRMLALDRRQTHTHTQTDRLTTITLVHAPSINESTEVQSAEFTTELVVGNDEQIYVLLVMVIGFTERSLQYLQLQMAAVRNKKQAITKRFNEILLLKTFVVQRRPSL